MKLSTKKDIFKFVTFIQEGLNYVDEWTPTLINNGGCGIFTKLLSEKLTEKKIKHELYAIYLHYDNAHIYEKNLIEFLNNGSSLKNAGATHLCVKVNDLYIDSRGIINSYVLHARSKIKLSKDVLDKFVIGGNWNLIFDKSCIPHIEDKLNFIFENYENFESGYFSLPKKGKVKLTNYTIKAIDSYNNNFNFIENIINLTHLIKKSFFILFRVNIS